MATGRDLRGLRDLSVAADKHIENIDIEPEDSASNAGSRFSASSRASSRSSTRSSASAKARATAKKAILEAEAAAMQRLYALEEEQLRLQQRKRQLELQTNIAKAEAEERVYAEADAQERRDLFVIDQTGDDTEDIIHPRNLPGISGLSATPPNVTERKTTDDPRAHSSTMKRSHWHMLHEM